MALAAVCLGSLLSVLQVGILFILSDLRDRVMRIESREMERADRLRQFQGVT